jgi:uncharacterized protein with GYD domain
MIFIQLNKLRRKRTREDSDRREELRRIYESKGIKPVGSYFTLGRYDTVAIFEAPDEKTALWLSHEISDLYSSETLVAIKREDALKLVE